MTRNEAGRRFNFFVQLRPSQKDVQHFTLKGMLRFNIVACPSGFGITSGYNNGIFKCKQCPANFYSIGARCVIAILSIRYF